MNFREAMVVMLLQFELQKGCGLMLVELCCFKKQKQRGNSEAGEQEVKERLKLIECSL